MEKEKKLKPKNGKLPGWAIAVIIIASFFVMAFYVAFIALIAYIEVTEETNANKPTIYDTVDDYGKRNVTSNFKTNVIRGYYEPTTKMYVIEGTVVNKTNKDYDFVEMTFSLYSGGGKVGNATAIVGDIDKRESKSFVAISKANITEGVDDYKLLKITAEPEKEIVD